MSAVMSDGWIACPRCGEQAWQYVAKGLSGLVTLHICGRCDRRACGVCKAIDWSGVKESCCGKPLNIPPEKKV